MIDSRLASVYIDIDSRGDYKANRRNYKRRNHDKPKKTDAASD
jgi:hypothetical protein